MKKLKINAIITSIQLEEEDMNELENIDNINIDELYNRIVVLIENAKRNVAVKVN